MRKVSPPLPPLRAFRGLWSCFVALKCSLDADIPTGSSGLQLRTVITLSASLERMAIRNPASGECFDASEATLKTPECRLFDSEMSSRRNFTNLHLSSEPSFHPANQLHLHQTIVARCAQHPNCVLRCLVSMAEPINQAPRDNPVHAWIS